MVEKISPASPTAAAVATQVGHSTSITSEPDNAWVAERQAEITARLKKRGDGRNSTEDDEPVGSDDDPGADRHLDHHSSHPHEDEHDASEKRLSGESERIGTGNLDDEIPFGEHVGYL